MLLVIMDAIIMFWLNNGAPCWIAIRTSCRCVYFCEYVSVCMCANALNIFVYAWSENTLNILSTSHRSFWNNHKHIRGCSRYHFWYFSDNAFDVCLSVFWMCVCVCVYYMLKCVYFRRALNPNSFVFSSYSRICETFQNGCGSKTKNIIATYIWLATFLILCGAIYNLTLTFCVSSHSVSLCSPQKLRCVCVCVLCNWLSNASFLECFISQNIMLLLRVDAKTLLVSKKAILSWQLFSVIISSRKCMLKLYAILEPFTYRARPNTMHSVSKRTFVITLKTTEDILNIVII